ncbi:MAG: isocitrate/isopropylmalate dehydrogenase family protein [Actinobacteria bacterium]|nr:isocitrate/isopropylmalate dehydrogenase family protein [Actinomycetota bacterium]
MAKHRITLIPGDGIGPEISEAMRIAVEATGVDIEWVEVNAGQTVMDKYGTPLPDEVLDAIKDTKVAIKGPITTPVGTGFRSVNVTLRKELDLYACVRPAFSIEGAKSKFENVDLIVFRENTEDLYAGIERMVDEDTAESIKRITRRGTERISRFAFEYAKKHGRKKVTVVHKANIMKFSDGLFLKVSSEVAKEYEEIEFEDRIVDNMCMQLVMHPENYDCLLCPNLYGDIISDLAAGLVGGLGIAPGANIGDEYAVFEPVHGSAPKYAGMNKANPTALILSAWMMLDYLGEKDAAQKLLLAVKKTIKEAKKVTYDLGGTASTFEMAEEIARNITG